MVTLPPMPDRIARLPRDDRGFPLPWFVAWADGKPVFPRADAAKLRRAIAQGRCWVCGEPLGRFRAFVIGPMCSINRASAEPPMHRECAEFSAAACPFLTKPLMRRAELDGPTLPPTGHMILRNAGACCVWVCREYDVEVHDHGVMFRLGDPASADWYARGRPATRAEVQASMEAGLPELAAMAAECGPTETAALERATAAAMRYLPAPPAGREQP